MDKLKAIWAKLTRRPVVKALLIWAVALIFLAFIVDKIVMPVFAGHLTSTEIVPNLEGMDSPCLIVKYYKQPEGLNIFSYKYGILKKHLTAIKYLSSNVKRTKQNNKTHHVI